MFRTLALTLAMCLTATFANAQAGTNIADQVIDESYFSDEMAWRGGRKMPFHIKVTQDEGFFAICVALQGVNRSDDRRAFEALNITLNGRVMMRGIDWGARYPAGRNVVGQPAKCRRTASPLVSNPQIGFQLQRNGF